MLTLCLLALLATPGQVITLNASSDYVNAESEAKQAQVASYIVVLNPAINRTVMVETRPTAILAGVRIKWIDRSLKTLCATYEGIVTNDGRILLDSGLFVSVDRIPERPKGKR